MQTTGYQAQLLDALAQGGGVLVWQAYAGRVAGWWLEFNRTPTRRIQYTTARLLLERGWIVATRKPGGHEFTGRVIITKFGRAALVRYRHTGQ